VKAKKIKRNQKHPFIQAPNKKANDYATFA